MLDKKSILTEKEIEAKRKLLNGVDHDLAATFKALGDVTRLRLFRILIVQRPIRVKTLAKILGRSIPLTSQHVKILTHAKLLKKNRTENNIFCTINHENPYVKELIKTIHQAMKSTV